jgi:exopolyphosphatase/guanosine-5'-triphosphate,3'-diphosphate pyrophosphatase
MPSPAVAVIDIGSNTIKVLVAHRGPDGQLHTDLFRALDVRISTGISHAHPRLGPEGIARGVAAVSELLAAAQVFAPVRTSVVATSAVRDAANGAEFCAAIRAATGHDPRILSGTEEADYIGRGLTCDPQLKELQDFHVFDLGGGSLECLSFRQRRVQQVVSLPLGCVRLTEMFVSHPEIGLPATAAAQITTRCRAAFAAAGYRFDPAGETVAVGTGGTLAVALAIEAAMGHDTAESGHSRISVAQLRAQFNRLRALPLAERCQTPGLPAARADVYPTGLITLIAVADLGGFGFYRHSFYNLRYGIAREALDAQPAA